MSRASLLLLLPLLACDVPLDDTGVDDPHDEGEARWSYSGEHGPDAWAASYPECGGDRQSPIDISGDLWVEGDAPELVFHYGSTPLGAENNGHTVVFTVAAESDSTLEVDGASYTLEQFHFHAGSEHTRDGVRQPMEMHLVHTMGQDIAVVSLTIVEGSEDQPWFEAARWSELPVEGDEIIADEDTILDLANLVESQLTSDFGDLVYYEGSLTTPPCTEQVQWFILQGELALSASQIEAFTDLFPANFRPTQPLGDREMVYDAGQ